jgi:type IX secretion system substrate protein/WD40 repeat protein
MNKFLVNKRINPALTGLILYFLNITFSYSQGFNHTWLLGYNVFLDSYTTSTKARLNFDANNITLIPETRSMPFMQTQANISDANGNFLMSSNGCWIANANNDTMLNGDSLNPGLFTHDWCDDTDGLPLPHGNVIIPFPGDSTKFILFHQTGNYSANLSSTVLYYSIIDMSLDGGLGGVTQKNDTVLQDTLSWGIAACKHANGRDWWIVALKDNSNLIYKALITPSGISSVTSQVLNIPFAYANATQPTFSPDGTKFAYAYGYGGTNPFHDVRLFHFDRCSGNLSDTTYIVISDSSTGYGIAFSPNSKYLYHCSYARIFQINTDTNNILASVKTVATWDGFYSPIPPFGTYFWYLYLAANGKIYATTGGTVDISFIDLPDMADTLCEVQQHALHLPCYSARADVNHPNYYLGCDSTSGCPCYVGIEEQLKRDFRFRIFPNPISDNILNIGYLLPQNNSGLFQIYDVVGKTVFKYALPPWSNEQNFELPKLSDGIYQCVITSGNSRVSKKVAVINE